MASLSRITRLAGARSAARSLGVSPPARVASIHGLGGAHTLVVGVDPSSCHHQQHPYHDVSVGRSLPTTRFFSTAKDDKEEIDATADATAPPKETPSTSSTEPAPPRSPAEQLEFQAETRQLLDIVTHSLYTDKEVFLRELVSNASDALEKLRHLQVAQGAAIHSPDVPLEIKIETDEVNQTITISDSGIGLSREEMISNLGTIARSGSKAFVNQMEEISKQGTDPSRGIIGKFGVGFYSAFMVGDKVEVRSKSALRNTDQGETPEPLVWTSEGIGTYEIAEMDSDIRQDRGASVVIHLKPEHAEFCEEKRVETVLKTYSNFINFPIFLNGNRVNTIDAVWAKDPKEVDDETYSAFYKYAANAVDEPFDRLHFRADAPLDVKALFFIPSFHSERYSMGRMEPGVSLYSRKVLIESKSPDILPDWMRFIKGVVDSDDLPLSISRERAQDSNLIAKLRKALTRKFISHLTKMAKKDSDRYLSEFYKEYHSFLKEGICQDFEFQEPLSKLLYYESSKSFEHELSSLDEYIARCPPDQKDIFYLCAPTRDLALASPYLEVFDKAGREVLFIYSPVDDFVMSNLEKYQGRELVSVEKSDIDLGDTGKKNDDVDDKDARGGDRLTDKQANDFCVWFRATLPEKVDRVKVTNRLSSSPALVTDNESGAVRRMMRYVDNQEGGREGIPLPKQQVEINPGHPVIVGINAIRKAEPTLAKVCAEQVFDNCLVAAGLLDDSRSMLPRLNDLLQCVVKGATVDGGMPVDMNLQDENLEAENLDGENLEGEDFNDQDLEGEDFNDQDLEGDNLDDDFQDDTDDTTEYPDLNNESFNAEGLDDESFEEDNLDEDDVDDDSGNKPIEMNLEDESFDDEKFDHDSFQDETFEDEAFTNPDTSSPDSNTMESAEREADPEPPSSDASDAESNKSDNKNES